MAMLNNQMVTIDDYGIHGGYKPTYNWGGPSCRNLNSYQLVIRISSTCNQWRFGSYWLRWGSEARNLRIYPLVMTHSLLLKIAIYSGFTH